MWNCAGSRGAYRGGMTNVAQAPDRRPVPVRTILATIGLILATAALLLVIVETRRVLTWIVIAVFFAVALYPLTGWVQRRVLEIGRAHV